MLPHRTSFCFCYCCLAWCLPYANRIGSIRPILRTKQGAQGTSEGQEKKFLPHLNLKTKPTYIYSQHRRRYHHESVTALCASAKHLSTYLSIEIRTKSFNRTKCMRILSRRKKAIDIPLIILSFLAFHCFFFLALCLHWLWLVGQSCVCRVRKGVRGRLLHLIRSILTGVNE